MRLLSMRELKTVKGIPYHKQHIYKLIREAKFPRPVKLGEGTGRIAFVEAEVDAYIARAMAQRDAAPA